MAHHSVDVRPHGHPEHIDFLTAAGHKMYALFGIALYDRDSRTTHRPTCRAAASAAGRTVEWLPCRSGTRGTPNIAG